MFQKGSTSYELARYTAMSFIPGKVLNKFWKEDNTTKSENS